MLENISWSDFLLGGFGVLILYYLGFIIRYYGKDVWDYLHLSKSNGVSSNGSNYSDEEYKFIFGEIQGFTESIHLEILPKVKSSQEFLAELGPRLEGFKFKSEPLFQNALASHILESIAGQPWQLSEGAIREFLSGTNYNSH